MTAPSVRLVPFSPAYLPAVGRWARPWSWTRHGGGAATGGRRSPALMATPETSDVEQFVLGIDADNAASLRAASAAGYVPLTTEPDAEDMVHVHALR